jgi:hybrid polyketide synthase/nonribosomal peptide synthetase ACE1
MKGFGGTNAHAIIEGYEPQPTPETAPLSFSPLTVSAASSSALRSMLLDLQSYLTNNQDANIRDVAHTLQARRSTFAFRKSFPSYTTEDALDRIANLLSDTTGENGLNSRYGDVNQPAILGVFTGQGAQWPRMGAWLIEKSQFVAQRLNELDQALSTLPEGDRPDWTLTEQLLADASKSRLSQAAIAQPLCTAIQIVLVDLMTAADIQLGAVVGHSSGEIGAAYAAGFLSATDAIRVAYYRGVYAKLSRSPADTSIKGAMMAAGTSYEDALEFCELDEFAGRIQVAARNSSNSVTLSGDEDAIDEAVTIFKDEGRFARKLLVDTAYHSHHMQACAGPYLNALERCKVTPTEGNGIKWFSSVVDGQVMTKEHIQDSQYWVDNMTGAVLFAPAVANAIAEVESFDIAIEFGPHPALKGPCLDTIEEAIGHKIPYTGLLARQKRDVDELSSALGFIWTQLGSASINFAKFEDKISGASQPRQLIANLPLYPFDHSRSFYNLTRFSGGHQNAHAPLHPLLGRRCVETEADDEISWRNVLRSSEISWLSGHALQGQAVFPAMGYIAMAVEAAACLSGPDRKLGLISLESVVIGRAMAFSDESVGMEAKITLKITKSTDDELHAKITCHSGLPYDSATPFALNFSTEVNVVFHEPSAETLPAVKADEINLANADPKRLYSQFDKLGYNYSSPFTGVKAINRKKGFATGEIEDISGDNWEDQLIVHPGLLDSALQTAFAAYCHPHDERFWTLHVPTAIKSIIINPYFTERGAGRYRQFQYQSSSRDELDCPVVADIDVFAGEGQSHAFVQFESVQVQPFAPSGPRDDSPLFSRFAYKLADPNAREVVDIEDPLQPQREAIFLTIERVGFFFLRRVFETITPEEAEATLPHFKLLVDFTRRTVPRVARGDHPTVPKEAMGDTIGYIRSMIAKYRHRSDMQLIEIVGENLIPEIRRSGSMIEHMLKDGVLDRFYEEGFDVANVWISRIIAQISHRHPRMRIFEVGAGTGGSTRAILPALGDAFSSYTFTDLSAGFFERANDRFINYSDRMVYATYNMEVPPVDQGYEEGTYDVVLASNALHATGKIEETIENARRLLKPGGYMVLVEIMGNDFLGIGCSMGGLPGWWLGAAVDETRCDGPCLTVDQWDALVRRHGFNGVETHTPLDRKTQWYAVLVCQAIDDRVVSLRNPLSDPTPATNTTNPLVIVGGRTPKVAKLAKEASELLKSHYTTITHVESLEELNATPLITGSSVLSLTELDQQFLEVRTESKLDALKTLWRNSRTIVWVTRGARNESPYSASMLGLARVVRFEYPHLNLQVVDFDVDPKPDSVASSLLRLELGKALESEDANLLWTVEPELHYVGDQLFIPRLYPYLTANDRYNTYRRTVSKQVNPQETSVVLEPTVDGKSVKPCILSPLTIRPEPENQSGKQTTVQVRQSLLQFIKFREAGFFALCSGTSVESGESLIAIVDTLVESTVRVPAEYTLKVSDTASTNTALVSAAAQILAQSIISAAPRSGSLVVHEASELLKETIDKEAGREGVQVVFTTAVKPTKKDDTTVFIHEKLPTRLVKKLLPQDISLFINLSSTSGTTELLTSCLPLFTATASVADFIRIDPGNTSGNDGQEAVQVLKSAWSAVTNQRRRVKTLESEPAIPLEEVSRHNPFESQLSIVDWSSKSVNVSLKPIDSGNIFRPGGTYFLLGLSGELGQSLCTWMVAHGARNVVLSSRRPIVEPRYIEEQAAKGANVMVLAVDVTSRESLRKSYDTICAEMPPIIGVANGAMILEDVMFDDLQFESQERTMPPKVEGSLYLDELFYDTPLDFFILFTSLAQVGGNTGQSTYVMANLFMTALAAQRRDVRGVAGSDMAIGSVTGMGFFERSSLDPDHFSRKGYRNMSEQDYHQQFAEAILAGRPGAEGVSEVVVGLQPYRDTPNIQAQLRTDPRFRHFLLQDRDANAQGQAGAGNGGAKPRVRLATVKTRGEALAVVEDAFIERLKRILLMSTTEIIDPMVSLVELGADSIMAVDVRAWFLKELDVDLPVLKILGPGETVAMLVEEAIDKLPVEIVDVSKLSDVDEAPVTLATAHKPESAPAIVATASSAASSSVAGSDSPPSTQSPPETRSETPLETPLGTEADFFAQKSQQLHQKLQKHQENTGQSWRQSIIESSTEHTEQMTFGQNRFWFLNHYVDDPTTFNIAYLGKLMGRIRIDDLAKAIEAAAQRHESLRTRFFWSNDDTKTPMQGILSKPLVRLERATITSPAEAAQELDIMRDYVWDLGDWVPLRMRLLSLSDTEHFLIIGTHHISMDGHSFSVLMMDIQQAYNSPGHRLTPMPDSSQARAFGAQQRIAYETGKLRSAIDHYRGILPAADLARPIELFSFARTQVRPALDRYGTHVAKIQIPLEITSKLKQLARTHRATAFHAYLAALQALLFRLLPASTTDKVFVGLADANRLDSKFMGSIGNFLNVLPVRFDRSDRQTFGQAMEVARDRAYGALKHSALPFDLLLDELEVPRSNAWAPVFQVFMDYRLTIKEHANKDWIGCKIGEENWHTSRSGYDVALEIMEGHDGAMLAIHVQKALYDAAGADLLVKSYFNILKQIATKGAKLPVKELAKWDAETVKKGLAVGNGTYC